MAGHTRHVYRLYLGRGGRTGSHAAETDVRHAHLSSNAAKRQGKPDDRVDVPLGRLELYQRNIDPVLVAGGAAGRGVHTGINTAG